MNVLELLTGFQRQDINIELADSDNLKINAPEGKLTPALVKELKDNKKHIVEFLKSRVQKKLAYTSIEPVEKKEYYILSSAQRRLYILQQMELGSVSYNLPNLFVLEGSLDKDKLEVTFEKLIARHESLRTSFLMAGGQLVQRIHAREALDIQYYEGGGQSNSSVVTTMMKDFIKPFDLDRPPLMRIGIIKECSTRYILLFDMHHIITDNLSQDILTREFAALYSGIELHPLRIQYKDYSQWQDSKEEKEQIKKQEAYWVQVFKGEIPVLNLPTDYPRPKVQSFEGDRVLFNLGVEETTKLNQLAHSQGATLFMVLLSVFNILLSKLTSQEDIVVGTDVAGRNHADLGNIMGVFINTLALRNFPEAEKAVTSLLKDVKTRTLEAFQNQDYQFEDLVDRLLKDRDFSRNALFDVMFSFVDIDRGKVETPARKKNQTDTQNYRYERKIAKFDLMLFIVKEAGELHFNFEYCTKLYKKETIKKFTGYFNEIVSAVTEMNNIKIKDIPISHHLLTVGTDNVQIDFGF